jgi:NAD(P)-dependent dehydrogenase (short-subunit alcohol dehydrogenase family)
LVETVASASSSFGSSPRVPLRRGGSAWSAAAPPPELAALSAEVHAGIDVTSDAGLAAAKGALAGQHVDLLVIVAGLLERNTLDALDVDSVRAQFEVNALAPLRLVAAFAGQIPEGGKIALLTSRMGSIADNDSGSHYGYRMSKAALNAAGKSLAIDLAPRKVAVGIYHPGYVRTRMTGNTGLIDADESARLLLLRIDELSPAESGVFRHANGEVLPW